VFVVSVRHQCLRPPPHPPSRPHLPRRLLRLPRCLLRPPHSAPMVVKEVEVAPLPMYIVHLPSLTRASHTPGARAADTVGWAGAPLMRSIAATGAGARAAPLLEEVERVAHRQRHRRRHRRCRDVSFLSARPLCPYVCAHAFCCAAHDCAVQGIVFVSRCVFGVLWA